MMGDRSWGERAGRSRGSSGAVNEEIKEHGDVLPFCSVLSSSALGAKSLRYVPP